MKKVLTIFSIIVISLFVLSLYGWMVKQIAKGEKKFGVFTEPVKFMYNFPDIFKQSVEEVKSLPKTFIPTPKDFNPINNLEEDLLVLTSYTNGRKSRAVALRNLKNDSILKEWTFKNARKENHRIVNPILHPDGSLIYNYYYQPSGLKKIDSTGNIVWTQKNLLFHHGMNLNKDGDIWASTKIPGWKATGMYILGGKKIFYIDYTIAKIDHKTGEILFHKSISEILTENNLGNYLLKSAVVKDPVHLNDVQPALKTTKYFKEDDVFISLRNMSIVLHYRPSTNELIQLIEGPFINQHDVDFLNDSTLVFFNNNTPVDIPLKGATPHKKKERVTFSGKFYSNIIKYNLKDQTFSAIGDSLFIENDIYTKNEGLMEFIDASTYFVEEQNQGLLWVIDDDKVIYKNVFKSQHKGHHHLPNWTRIIKHYD